MRRFMAGLSYLSRILDSISTAVVPRAGDKSRSDVVILRVHGSEAALWVL